MIVLPGCVEETIISNRPFLAGVPGAVTGRPVTAPTGARESDATPPDQLIVQTPDGKTELIARTGRQLMIHIFNTLNDDDADLFVDQVLSEMTKQEFYQRGLDPKEAFIEMQRRREDIDALFALIPMGESTPGAIVTNQGRKTLRIELVGMAARGLTWRGMDMTLEKGNFKLRWFVDGFVPEE